MRLIFLLLIAIVSSTARADDNAEKEATLLVANQHMVLNFLSALYYCNNKHWPESVETLQAFRDKESITLPVEPNWALLESASFSFEVTDKVVVRSAKGAIPDAHAITSTNSSPGCQDRHLEVKANMHIDQ